MIRKTVPPLVALFALAIVLAATAPRQDFSYTSETSFEMSGVVGAVLSRSMRDGLTQDTYVREDRMITRSGTERTIIDLTDETITTVDDRAQSYSVLSFDDFRAFLAQATAVESSEDDPGDDADSAEEYRMTLDVQIEDRGPEEANGYDAHRFHIHIVGDVTAEDEDGSVVDQGQFAVVMALWTGEVEGASVMKTFSERYAEKLGITPDEGETGRSMMEAVEMILGSDPAVRASLERAREEAAGISGIPIRQIMHLVTVPPGMEYDGEQVFAPQEKESGGRRLGRLARRVAREATGSGGDDAAQRTALTITTDYSKFGTAPAPGEVVTIPDGYTEVASPLGTPDQQ